MLIAVTLQVEVDFNVKSQMRRSNYRAWPALRRFREPNQLRHRTGTHAPAMRRIPADPARERVRRPARPRVMREEAPRRGAGRWQALQTGRAHPRESGSVCPRARAALSRAAPG